MKKQNNIDTQNALNIMSLIIPLVDSSYDKHWEELKKMLNEKRKNG